MERFFAKLKSLARHKSEKSKGEDATALGSQSAQPGTSSALRPAPWTSDQHRYGGSRYTSMPSKGVPLTAQDQYRRRILGFTEEEYREYVPGERVKRATYEVEVLN